MVVQGENFVKIYCAWSIANRPVPNAGGPGEYGDTIGFVVCALGAEYSPINICSSTPNPAVQLDWASVSNCFLKI